MTHKIVVIGGGFAGLRAVAGATRQLELSGQPPEPGAIALVSPDPWLTMRVRLYELDEPLDGLRVPLASVLGPLGALHLPMRVEAIDPERRRLTGRTPEGEATTVEYERLVVATGSQLHRPDLPGLGEYAHSVDTYDDSAKLRAHLAALPTASAGEGRFTAVVIGAGFTGIEAATELAGHLFKLAAQPGESARVVLLERADVVGPELGPGPRPAIEEALRELAVDVRLGQTVTRIERDGVVLGSGERILARTVLWTVGLRANPLVATLGCEHDELGRVRVDPQLRVSGVKGVFAAGDVARAPIGSDHATLMSCQHALTLGTIAGHNAARDLLGQPLLEYAPPSYQTCLDLGAWGAVYCRGWDRAVISTRAEAKTVKQTINRVWIYPPSSGDRADILATASTTWPRP